MSIQTILEPKAALVAMHLRYRFEKTNQDPHNWRGYMAPNQLHGWMDSSDVAIYCPEASKSDARVYFRTIRLKDIAEIEWQEPETLESNIVERAYTDFDNQKDVGYEEKVSHTFSKTLKRSKRFEQEFTLAAEASIGTGEGSPVSASFSFTTTSRTLFAAEYGEETTKTDTVERTLTVPPHTSGRFEITRSVDKMRQHYKAYAKLGHDIVFVCHRWGKKDWYRWVWESWEDFVDVACGEGNASLMGYDLFRQYPLNAGEKATLKSIGRKEVSGYYDYDNVAKTDVKIT